MKSAPAVALLWSAALLLAVPSCQREGSDAAKKRTGKAGTRTGMAGSAGAPKLELFVMSQCPFGTQVVDAAAEVKKQLGADLTVDIQYIGDGAAGSLRSMHGPSEVTGDLAQVCAIDIAPDRALDFMVCQNKDMKSVDSNWRECAGQTGVDADALASCVEGDRGQELLAASFAEAKKRGADGSPTIFLAGKPYEGGRKPRDFLKAICGAIEGQKPEVCSNIPEPPRVDAIFLSDSRCAECNIAPLEGRLKSVLGGLVVKNIDYGSEEGKALYTELAAAGTGFKYLPAVLLDPAVEKDPDGYAELKRFLRPVGNYRELAMGGRFDPTAEICANAGVDDDKNGKADCADPACKNEFTCRPAKPKQLDMFVMSQCPYGAKAMIAAKELVDLFGNEVKLGVYFIGDEANGQFQSLHGQPEVDEDIRERCAMEKYKQPKKYMQYLACRSRDYKNDNWQPCATESGMDPKLIQACFDGEGKKLISQSFAVAKSMNISASPTFVVNNKRQFNAIAVGPLAKEFCKDNPGLAKCNDPIVTAQPDPATASAEQPAGQCD